MFSRTRVVTSLTPHSRLLVSGLVLPEFTRVAASVGWTLYRARGLADRWGLSAGGTRLGRTPRWPGRPESARGW